jgi:hypothetical protein
VKIRSIVIAQSAREFGVVGAAAGLPEQLKSILKRNNRLQNHPTKTDGW